MIKDIYGQGLKSYSCTESYKPVEDPNMWRDCPNCGLKPLIWVFDNGRSTACGCGNNLFDHFSIYAESIMSVIKRSNGSCAEYEEDELMNNWNHWVKTGEELFLHSSKRTDGKW